jgi:disulfide bond formation protein DsbB
MRLSAGSGYLPRSAKENQNVETATGSARSGLVSARKVGSLQRHTAGRGRQGVSMTEMAVKANWSAQLRRQPAVVAAFVVFAGSTATILGAWYFQYVLRYQPCPLCLEERLPYYVVIPLSLVLAIAAILRAPRPLIVVGFLAIIAVMLASAALGAYHAGVEWRWWPGPTDCSGPMTDFTTKPLLDQLRNMRVVRCDEAAWRLLGLSLAGYNVLISLALAGIAALGLAAQTKRN